MSILLKFLKRNWIKLYFVLSLALAIFGYGVAVGVYLLPPYDFLQSGFNAAKEWINVDKATHYMGIRPGKFILPARHPESGATIHMPGQPQKGLTLITSMWEDTHGIDLIDLNGELIHKWRVSLNKVLPEVKNLPTPLEDWDAIILGVMPYLNGDVIFVFGYAGLVKIDKCSNIIWKISHPVHHSIHEDNEGNLWIPGKKTHLQPVDRLPFFIPPINEELLLKNLTGWKNFAGDFHFGCVYQVRNGNIIFCKYRWGFN